MSIAISTQRTRQRVQGLARMTRAERIVLSREARLREARAMMRHFAFAFLMAGTALYAAVALSVII